MLISLHRQASTTPELPATIEAGTEPAPIVAGSCGISRQTASKRRDRDQVHNCSHGPHRSQTTLTPAREVVAVSSRKSPLLPGDLQSAVRD